VEHQKGRRDEVVAAVQSMPEELRRKYAQWVTTKPTNRKQRRRHKALEKELRRAVEKYGITLMEMLMVVRIT
jgi:hypothetical protein